MSSTVSHTDPRITRFVESNPAVKKRLMELTDNGKALLINCELLFTAPMIAEKPDGLAIVIMKDHGPESHEITVHDLMEPVLLTSELAPIGIVTVEFTDHVAIQCHPSNEKDVRTMMETARKLPSWPGDPEVLTRSINAGLTELENTRDRLTD